MFLIDYVTPENAEGKIAEVYGLFPKQIGPVGFIQLLTASTGVFDVQRTLMDYMFNKSNIHFDVLSAIRFLAASLNNQPMCINFNSALLKAAGVTDDELASVVNDPLQGAPFELKDRMLLAFVKKGLIDPSSITREDIDELITAGWTEKDALDAMYLGCYMAIPGKLSDIFSKK